jgi:pimeloyl-ACP methyl ester carboxylesterase
MNTPRLSRRRGTWLLATLLTAVVLALQPAIGPARAAAASASAAVPGACVEGVLPHGALSMICVPASGWNGELLVWAHGYVAFNEPLDFYHLGLAELSLPDFAQSLGFAFATTSYRQNGLAILEGVDDVTELLAAFPASAGQPASRTYLVGASEGGIVATLFAERKADLIDGALALCGPIGDFTAQVDYVGDFRVLFDYFFPGILPGQPTQIPAELIAGWESVYVPRVRAALAANPNAAYQLIKTSRAAIEPGISSSVESTTVGVLWYSVFGTNDAAAKLGGNPYGNIGRWYVGSTNDLLLNLRVKRVARHPAAAAALVAYQTSGHPGVPLVTLHTTGDPIIPFWHEKIYALKSGGSVPAIAVGRYGHCSFTPGEVVGAFGLLRQMTAGQP